MRVADESMTPLARGVFALALACLAVAVYWPVRCGEFVSDDFRFIVDHTAQLTRPDAPGAFFTDKASNATPSDPDIWRPLRTSSYALEYHAFGLDPCGFHAVSIGLHALVCVLTFVWLTGLLSAPVALCGAALFAVHPLAVEAVGWISSRSDLLVAASILCALLFSRRCERTGRGWLGMAVLGLVAGFSKESGVMLPALYLIDARMRHGRWFAAGSRAPFVAACCGALAYLVAYFTWFRAGVVAQVAWYGGSFGSHLPYALLGLGTLLRLVVWPSAHHFLWEPALFAPAEPLIVWGAAGAAVVFGLAIALTWRPIPLVRLGLAFAFVALLPAANLLLPMRTVLAERFAYVPLLGVALAVAAGLSRFPRKLRVGATLAGLAVLAPLTWQRASEFATPRALYDATLRDWPRSSSALMGLAELDRERGQFAAAAARFDAAADAALPDRRQSWRCRIAAAQSRLEGGDAVAAKTGFDAFIRALDADPKLAAACADFAASAWFGLAQALALNHEYGASTRCFEELTTRFPGRPQWLDAWGEVERVRGEPKLAIERYTLALALDPDHHPARLHRALVLADFPALRVQAIAELRELLVRDPTNARARAALDTLSR